VARVATETGADAELLTMAVDVPPLQADALGGAIADALADALAPAGT
jgi:hypothetical protein